MYNCGCRVIDMFNLSIKQRWEPRHLSQYSDGVQAGQLGFNFRQGKEIFLFSAVSRLALEPTSQWVPGTISLGAKQLRHEDDLSSLSSAEVKNNGAKPPLCHSSSWHGAQLIKHRNNFTF
jgi:hypothetical protein